MAALDKGIVPHVVWFNNHGLPTIDSCEGHERTVMKGRMMIKTRGAADIFVKGQSAAKSLWDFAVHDGWRYLGVRDYGYWHKKEWDMQRKVSGRTKLNLDVMYDDTNGWWAMLEAAPIPERGAKQAAIDFSREEGFMWFEAHFRNVPSRVSLMGGIV